MKSRHTTEQKLAAAARVDAGETYLAVARSYGVSITAVHKWVKRVRKGKRFKEDRETEVKLVVDLYLSGKSMRQVSDETEHSVATVQRWLKEQPQKVTRPRGHQLGWTPQPKPGMTLVIKALAPAQPEQTTRPVLVVASVLEPSSIRPLTREELMVGKAGGYRAVLSHHN